MNALIQGQVMPIDAARQQVRKRMAELGITQARVQISQAWTPPRHNYTDAHMDIIQSALLKGQRHVQA